MTTKYKTVNYAQAKIEIVSIDRETDASVWIDGRRYAKMSEGLAYHDTWVEAHNHLMALAKSKVSLAKLRLDRANSVLGNVKGMKKP